MKKNLMLVTIIMLFVFATTLFAYGRGGEGAGSMSILTALDLPNEQQEKMKELMSEHQKEMTESRENIQNKQKDINDELVKGTTDPERLETLNNELLELQSKKNKEQIANCLETKKVIGSEKLKKLFELQAKKDENKMSGSSEPGERQGRGMGMGRPR